MGALPPGFVLDNRPPPARGALPSGFVLDQSTRATGEQHPNIAHKGDMTAGDRIKPDLHTTAVQGMTLNAADEAASAIGAPIHALQNRLSGEGPTSLGENYQQLQARQAAQLASTREQHPMASVATEVGGALATAPFTGAGRLLATGGKAYKALKGAGAGAAYGGAAGFMAGDGLEDRTEQAQEGAKWGAGLGAVAPTVAAGVGKIVGKVFDKPAVRRTMDDVKADVATKYTSADTGLGNVLLEPEHFNRLRGGFNSIADKAGMGSQFGEVTDKIYPQSKAFIKAINNYGGNPTFGDIEKARQLLRSAVEDNRTLEGLKPDGFMAQRFIDAVDNFVAMSPYKEARKAYQTLKKSEDIADAFWRAELRTSANYTQAGMATALKQEFKRLAMDEARFKRTFNEAEQNAILAVINGTTTQNALRRIGMLAPTGQLSQILYTVFGFANPALAIPAVGGAIARRASTAKTLKNARGVQDLVHNAGVSLPKTKGRYENLASDEARKRLLGLAGQIDPSARP